MRRTVGAPPRRGPRRAPAPNADNAVLRGAPSGGGRGARGSGLRAGVAFCRLARGLRGLRLAGGGLVRRRVFGGLPVLAPRLLAALFEVPIQLAVKRLLRFHPPPRSFPHSH